MNDLEQRMGTGMDIGNAAMSAIDQYTLTFRAVTK